jgi:hypothetical protein
MPTKITNTNTNINRININVPKPKQVKVTPKSVSNAEEQLRKLETEDLQYTRPANVNVSVNPNVYGFNKTPLEETVRVPTVEEPIIDQPEIPVGQAIPMNIEDRGIQAQVFIPIKSDFEERLSKQEGFQPTNAFEMPKLEPRFIKKQGRPDINEMAKEIIKNRPKTGLRG